MGRVDNVIFDGIDFEGTRYMHCFRSFGQVTMTVRNSSFLQTDSSGAGQAAASLSIWKATGAQQSRVVFDNNGVKGYWKGIKAIDIDGNGSLIEIHERATTLESNVKFNNVAWTGGPLLVQSKCGLGHAHWRDSWVSKFLVGAIIYREASGKLEQSTDWGVTWKSMDIGTSPINVTGVTTTNLKIGGSTATSLVESTLFNAFDFSASIPALSIPAQTSLEVTFSVPSAQLNDSVSINISTLPLGLAWSSYVSSTGNVKLRISNITASAISIDQTHNVRVNLTRYA
ncbi:hypothetical protein D3C71_868130 [compost metagenome]